MSNEGKRCCGAAMSWVAHTTFERESETVGDFLALLERLACPPFVNTTIPKSGMVFIIIVVVVVAAFGLTKLINYAITSTHNKKKKNLGY